MWYVHWKPEYFNEKRCPLLGYGAINSNARMKYIMPHSVTNGSATGRSVFYWVHLEAVTSTSKTSHPVICKLQNLSYRTTTELMMTSCSPSVSGNQLCCQFFLLFPLSPTPMADSHLGWIRIISTCHLLAVSQFRSQSSSRNGGIWVLFPQPVSPLIITTWCSFTASKITFMWPQTGSISWSLTE